MKEQHNRLYSVIQKAVETTGKFIKHGMSLFAYFSEEEDSKGFLMCYRIRSYLTNLH